VGLSPESANVGLVRVRAVAKSLLQDPIDAGIVELEGKPLVYASVPRADESFHPMMTAGGDIFVREGSRTRQLDEREEMELLRRGPPPVCHSERGGCIRRNVFSR